MWIGSIPVFRAAHWARATVKKLGFRLSVTGQGDKRRIQRIINPLHARSIYLFTVPTGVAPLDDDCVFLLIALIFEGSRTIVTLLSVREQSV